MAGRASYVAVGQVVIRLRGIVLLPILVRALGADGYGDLAAAQAAALLLVAVAPLNLADGAARLVIGAPTASAALSRLRAIRRFLIAVMCILLLAAAISVAVGSRISALSLFFAAALLSFKAAALHLEYFQQARRLVKYQVAAEYSSACLGLGMAVPFGTAGYLIAAGSGYAAIAALAWRSTPPGTKGAASPILMPALRLALPLLPVNFAQWALAWANSLLIFNLIDAAAAGAYSAAYSISSVALILSVSVSSVWPQTAQRLLSNGDARALRRTMLPLVGAIVAVGTVMVAGAFLVRPLVGPFLGVDAFTSSAPLLPVLVAGLGVYALAKVAEGLLYALGRVWTIVGAYAVGAILSLSSSALLISTVGVLGGAIGIALGYAIALIVMTADIVHSRRKGNSWQAVKTMTS